MKTLTRGEVLDLARLAGHPHPEADAVLLEAFAVMVKAKLMSEEPKPWHQTPHQVTLTGSQLIEALNFIAPDRETDPDQLDVGVTIAYLNAAEEDGEITPAGLYMWDAEYPDEGVTPLSNPEAS